MDNLKKWKTEFGDRYTDRNIPTPDNVNARAIFWKELFNLIGYVPSSICEIGSGCGGNLMAINHVLSDIARETNSGIKINIGAIEPNDDARRISMQMLPHIAVADGEAKNLPWQNNSVELVFTSGVLIHIPPDELGAVMDEMYRISSKYILMVEYFAPNLEEVKYRDQDGMMWRNDFGGVMLDKYKMHVKGYGFAWKRVSKLDNVTWWLLEKVH